MRNLALVILGFVGLSLGNGIIHGEEEGGFRFPGGDPERGSEVFAGLQCFQCHLVKGVHFEEPEGGRKLSLMLGEEVRFVKNYEDIVKAITNPKHVVAKQYESLMTKAELGELAPFMTDFTNAMTVRQLMDLVSFLDKVYANSLEGYGDQ